MKNNTKLIVGIALPLVVILFVIGSAIFPSIFFHPKNDFLYTIDNCVDYNCRYYPYPYGTGAWLPYKVIDGHVVKETTLPVITNPIPNQPAPELNVQNLYPKINRYSVSDNRFNQVSFEDAQKIVITDAGSAPDGTVVVNGGYDNGGIVGAFLGGERNYGLYLKNGSMTKKIIVENAGQPNYYNSSFHLVGWVK